LDINLRADGIGIAPQPVPVAEDVLSHYALRFDEEEEHLVAEEDSPIEVVPLDFEATGLDFKTNGAWQVAATNGSSRFVSLIRPDDSAIWETTASQMAAEHDPPVTRESLRSARSAQEVGADFLAWLDSLRAEKILFIAYNSKFDRAMVFKWLGLDEDDCNERFHFADAMGLAKALRGDRSGRGAFKLQAVRVTSS
jgi:hypothetical protein